MQRNGSGVYMPNCRSGRKDGDDGCSQNTDQSNYYYFLVGNSIFSTKNCLYSGYANFHLIFFFTFSTSKNNIFLIYVYIKK